MRFHFLALICISVNCVADSAANELYRPDPLAVQRFERGYRYPQAGWIVLHIEGEPYERGYQHGRLMAPEIAAIIRSFAVQVSHKDANSAWQQTRTLANALFLRKFDPEYLEEMKGIADGASAAGAKFDNRPIDLVDIVVLNCWAELFTLDNALEALPTGLEGKVFPGSRPRAMPPPGGDHCSAFAATAPATADGKILFGHITMFGLMSAYHFNVWLDIKPSKGHRVVMQSAAGGIQSGMDYYISSSGLMVAETTIRQTRFNGDGLSLASRIRKTLQYAKTIDEAVEILRKSNNGLYTNEWLLADANTNEIAMLELGTHASRLRRSSKGEWFGGAEGFYWGCNNTKDLSVRLETIASVHDRPENVVWEPSDRDRTWLKLYQAHQGKMTVDFGRLAFSTPPLAAAHSLDAKYTTTDMAKRLETFALFGPPLGRPWEPTDEEKQKYPNLRPLVSNPWTVLHPIAPAESKVEIAAKDILDKIKDSSDNKDEGDLQTQAAWHGTLLPAGDADVWLAAGFAKYERIVAMENAMKDRADDRKLTQQDREKLAIALETCRKAYLFAARIAGDVPLEKTKSDSGKEWYRIASGKGVMLLQALRQTIGSPRFEELMDQFGRANAGKEVETSSFVGFIDQSAPVPAAFWNQWLREPGIPDSDGSAFAIQSFHDERDKTIIVVGTGEDEAAMRQTAVMLQRLIRTRWSNETVPIRADININDDETRNHHLILIGRPDSNQFTKRFRELLPISFGPRSFSINGDTYAHPGSAVAAVIENPRNPRYSVVVLAGLSADSMTRTPDLLFGPGTLGADVVIAAHGMRVKPVTVSAKNWVGSKKRGTN